MFSDVAIKVVVCIGLTIPCSCRKFCDNWEIPQFFLQGIVNVFANSLYVTSKEFCKLLPVKPYSVILQPYFKPDGLVGLVEDYFPMCLVLYVLQVVCHYKRISAVVGVYIVWCGLSELGAPAGERVCP